MNEILLAGTPRQQAAWRAVVGAAEAIAPLQLAPDDSGEAAWIAGPGGGFLSP